jgi:hypothetical protein
MSEWVFDLSKITAKEIITLVGLAQEESRLTLLYFAELATKAGVDLDDVPVDRISALIDAFCGQAAEVMKSGANVWPGVWATWSEPDEEAEE